MRQIVTLGMVIALAFTACNASGSYWARGTLGPISVGIEGTFDPNSPEEVQQAFDNLEVALEANMDACEQMVELSMSQSILDDCGNKTNEIIDFKVELSNIGEE